MPMANGLDLGNASGFLTDGQDGSLVLITSWHVLSGRNSDTREIMSATDATPDAIRITYASFKYRADRHENEVTGRVDVVVPLRDEDGNAVWLEHPDHGSSVDVACIPVPKTVDVLMRPYPLVDTDTPYVGITERLSIIGYPFGLSAEGLPVWSQGFVATEPKFSVDGLPYFLIDSRTRPGQSGAPVIFYSPSGQHLTGPGQVVFGDPNTAVRLLGSYSGRIHPDSDLGKVWKVSAIRDVVFRGRRSDSL